MPRRRPDPQRNPSPTPSEAIVTEARTAGLMLPLDYVLAIVNDPNADPARRDRAARTALPYCHPRVADTAPGKKAQRAKAAKQAGRGTEWAGDLDYTDGKARQ
jgi:hypothetical protein